MSLRRRVEDLEVDLVGGLTKIWQAFAESRIERRAELVKAADDIRRGVEWDRQIDREHQQHEFKLCPRCGVWFFGCTNVYPHATLSKPGDRPDYCPRCCREIEAKPPQQ